MTEEENKAIDLLKFYEGFFKNIGHEEEVKSIEGVINLIEKLQKENEELKEMKELRDKANKYDAIKKYAVKKNLKDNEIIILSKYDVNNEINETINQLIDKHQEEMRKTGDEWGYETYVIKELEKLKKYFKGEVLKF